MSSNIFLGYPPENIKNWIIADAERKYQEQLATPLHFTAEQDKSSVSLVCSNWEDIIDSWCELEYSRTGKDNDWHPYIDPNSEDETLHQGGVIYLNKGETVYLRAKQGNVKENPNLDGFAYYTKNVYDEAKYHYFIMEGSIKAGGNIQFLLENTGTIDYVSNCCYSNMFEYCTALTQAPILPAKTLDYSCYCCMFADCTSLTQAPALPAETLTEACYSNMFYGCTSLKQAPALPAETLAESCYSNMFEGCTSLTKAPALPATTLAYYCYFQMFSGCTALNNINANFSAWDTTDATTNWLNGVAAEGTFTCPTTLPDTPRDASHIPEGWTRVNK